ncbi:hypothetical protein KAFR_0J00830 [Kazachstania africana CBS 2517]|uniref:Uncharacterized protein n=1 Tax=Kazachstania africana (strain ATCC 22294 / BCRC 22015 / CBS 2517 / CECT 1963 / NBRC 1671 / NRRL Y-8276) TaxID=1071382 RepID=H2B0K1_KAZAF|nr:hypothetical protein KAFR_0J00830 [Kazachstania africana CBS 2517]CCF60151.1 hypothetical protein KAFR_0J00830 [Kazachstania africana CBS 2517]
MPEPSNDIQTSPTFSEEPSFIFERNVEDPYLMSSGSNVTLTASNSNLNLTKKHRSNSNLFLQRQTTNDSVVSSVSSHASYVPVQPIAISSARRRLSRAQSTNNIMPSPGSLNTCFSGQSVSQVSTPVMAHHHHRRTLENMVAPALDASCSIIADKSTDLCDLNLVHSRNPSVIGLDMALGISRSSSVSNINEREPTNKESVGDNEKCLNFYSYADLLTDEKTNQHQAPISKPPPLNSSYSTSFIKHSNNNNNNPSFLNPFLVKRDSSSSYLSPPQNPRRLSNNNMFSRSPTSNSMNNPMSPPCSSILLQDGYKSKFHIDSSESDEFSSEEENNNNTNDLKTTSKSPGAHLLHPRSKRSSSAHNNLPTVASAQNISSPLMRTRTYSNTPISPTNITTAFLDRRRGSSVVSIQQLQISSSNATSPSSPIYPLKTEKFGDILRQKVTDFSNKK